MSKCRIIDRLELTRTGKYVVIGENEKEEPKEPEHHGEKCPKCGQYTLYMMEGCETCQSCGYSKCSIAW